MTDPANPMFVPPLESARLIIRESTMDDLDVLYRINCAGFGDFPIEEMGSRLRWQVLAYAGLAGLYQPPYGDRAIVLKTTRTVIGSVGYVPSFAPFGQLPSYGGKPARMTPEFGLFWVIDPAFQRQGFATEAAQSMIDHAFGKLNLQRIVATTEYDNAASQAVMTKLGMRLERNTQSTPEWFQLVGILDHP